MRERKTLPGFLVDDNIKTLLEKDSQGQRIFEEDPERDQRSYIRPWRNMRERKTLPGFLQRHIPKKDIEPNQGKQYLERKTAKRQT
ncbi:hypothetical protein QE152_g5505 [Popillia japonica]|uniref:Uncharacterized protein n=1 Tax=Popillia japonica TaxID=7064 RepID=A0AAW1MNA5_POPJA